jgi:hypothetical protein
VAQESANGSVENDPRYRLPPRGLFLVRRPVMRSAAKVCAAAIKSSVVRNNNALLRVASH